MEPSRTAKQFGLNLQLDSSVHVSSRLLIILKPRESLSLLFPLATGMQCMFLSELLEIQADLLCLLCVVSDEQRKCFFFFF